METIEEPRRIMKGAQDAPAAKPAADPGATEEHPTALAARIASRFALPSPVEAPGGLPEYWAKEPLTRPAGDEVGRRDAHHELRLR